MEFKIDTKDAFTTIMPIETMINAILAGELRVKCEQMRQSGSKNFIIDLHHCTDIDKSAIPDLIAFYEECYSNEQSLVFTGVNKKVMAPLKEDEADLLINIAPSMIEAVDIISMEMLERDLLSEE